MLYEIITYIFTNVNIFFTGIFRFASLLNAT